MKTRPLLRIGDMVMLNKNRHSNPDQMFRVVDVEVPVADAMKLRLIRRTRWPRVRRPEAYSSEGFTLIKIMGKDGVTTTHRRRELWKVPNQPREKKKADKMIDPSDFLHYQGAL